MIAAVAAAFYLTNFFLENSLAFSVEFCLVFACPDFVAVALVISVLVTWLLLPSSWRFVVY